MPTETSIRVATPRAAGKGAAADAEAPAKKSKKKLIIMVVLGAVVLFAVYHFMLAKKPAKAGPPQPGAVVAMEDTTLNLADGHFLKIKIALQAVKGAPTDIDTSKAQDLMIAEFTDQPVAVLSTAAGRDKLKADLLAKIQKEYPKEIMGLYFTAFVMQ
jgi:flagellar FliL protein